ncbi:AT-hook motif nuclear-localized protein 14 [Diospyros lotus]|uniref:AT-hook motif nuclear-localized protein 14 n=1 Tax=Diospyros lotus TaxID=55363 RepID=UPI0022517C06|nr:AT-hook motif nuclear-localized protein 14 [Diospyros lotus]
MEPNESGLSSYYHHHHQPPHPHPQPQQSPAATASAAAVTASPTNGILPNTDRPPQMLYPHSVPSAVTPPLETVRRKRGRPRKYGTPEQAAAAKRASASASISQSKKRDQSLGGVALGGGASAPSSSSSKKNQLAALGNAGHGFAPHIISIAAGEDVYQRIMLFMQQSKREICILSASGSITNPSLRQPATSGGNITYEGRFDIISLSGSYIRTELGGRTGGLSVCLSDANGQIIGGGIGGPLRAAGPVQVIVGTFLMDTKKDTIGGSTKGDASTSKFPSPVFHSGVDSSGRVPISGGEDHQNMSGSQFVIQPRAVQAASPPASDWRSRADARTHASFDLTGMAGHGAHHSPENGSYEQQFQD